ncbi:MAG TPA: hypothetical protein VIK74_09770 [Parasegetibacter sp.]
MFFPPDYPVELQNVIITLSESERENPELAIADFFDNFHLREGQNMIWCMLVAAASSDTGAFDSGIERNNLMFFYERLVKLVEAAYIIHNRSDFRGEPVKPLRKDEDVELRELLSNQQQVSVPGDLHLSGESFEA